MSAEVLGILRSGVCVFACVHACMCACVHMHVCVCMRVCARACVCFPSCAVHRLWTGAQEEGKYVKYTQPLHAVGSSTQFLQFPSWSHSGATMSIRASFTLQFLSLPLDPRGDSLPASSVVSRLLPESGAVCSGLPSQWKMALRLLNLCPPLAS